MKRIFIKRVICTGLCILLTSSALTSKAAENTLEKEYNSSLTEVVAYEKYLNAALDQMGTDVVQELEKQNEEYKILLDQTEDIVERQKIIDLMNEIELLIEEYSTINESSLDEDRRRASVFDTYASMVATVITWFYANGYDMAGELLTHARYNTDTGSFYGPTNSSIVKNSYIFNLIALGTSTSGSAEFPLNDQCNLSERDLYYAIYHFDYYKDSPSSRYVYIFDYYDFTKSTGYTSIAGIAVSTMIAAQNLGVLVPYTVLIYETI